MSDLPQGWALASIPEMLANEGLFSDGDWVESKDQDPEGDVRLIQLADVGDGSFRDRSARFLTSSKAQELGCTFLQPGDVLIARMPDPLGRACLFPGDSKASVTVVDVCVVRPSSGGVSPRWLMYTVNAPQTRHAMIPFEMGTTRKRISRKNLARIPLPVPPLAEQERIVAAIEEQLSRIDDGGAALDRVRARLDSLWRAVVDHAVEFPAGAQHVSGGDVFRYVTSGSRGWAKYYSMTGPAFLRVGNVQRSDIRLDLSDVQRVIPPSGAEGRRTLVQPGDVLITITADIGRVAVVPEGFEEAFINQHVAIARPREGVCPEYLAWFISGSNGQRQLRDLQRGMTKIGLGLDDIRALQIPLPDNNTQNSIARALNVMRTVVDGHAATIEKQIAKFNTLRSSILAAAFSGRLTPQDPSDEPASALLKRIATERASSNGRSSTRASKPGDANRRVPV